MTFEKAVQKNNPEDVESGSDNFGAFMQIQARLLFENHPDWAENAETFSEHSDDFERLAKEFREYADVHPEIYDQFKLDPDGTIQKLKNRFYH